MILLVPYSHVDINAASRLMKWLGWLSRLHGNSLRKESILLAASIRASKRSIHGNICELAARTFGEARCFVPDTEFEVGWPGACNFMFAEALKHISKHFDDDVLLIEPDAVPLCPEWLETIKDEWAVARAAGKEFMGNWVRYGIPHMTGIGIYGKNWPAIAPKLAEVQVATGWDEYAAEQVAQNAHFTKLIQHVWWRLYPASYESLSLEMVSPDAVLFHQCKHGRLMRLLDEELFQGRADRETGFLQQERVTMAYFLNHNLNRVVRSHGTVLAFDALDTVGGLWRGIRYTEDEAEVSALRSLAQTPGSGIAEITAEEYEERTKKKVTQSSPSTVSVPQPAAMQINQSPALLVEDPAASGIARGNGDTPESATLVENIDDVVRLGKVIPPDGPKKPARIAKKKK